MKKILLFVLLAAGCGSGYTSTPTPALPGSPNASVIGQYNLLLNSTNGHGATNIYTTFTQIGTTFTGGPKTLVCPSNDVSQCQGDDGQVTSITPTGTINGTKITMTISFPTTSGPDTVTMVGSASGTDLAGDYTDSQGDTGTWIAAVAGSLAGAYNGTFNSTSHPLLIAPAISVTLGQDSSFTLQGPASITGSPCIASLVLSGQAIGGAFSLSDATNKLHIIALPSAGTLNFSYSF